MQGLQLSLVVGTISIDNKHFALLFALWDILEKLIPIVLLQVEDF